MADRRVQAAVDHWAPRFIANGVDYNDFVATTRRVETWDGWLDAWTETADRHVELARKAEAAGHELTAGEAYLRAAVSLHFGKFVWVVDRARHEAATRRAVELLYEAHRFLDPSAERIEVPFDGAHLAANLRRPAGVERPPLVLLIPGLDSTKEEFFHLEQVFLDRGMATLSMDGPGQGESGIAFNIRPDYETAASAVLDAVADREDVDIGRVGALGVSLGGYYAPRAAAREQRIRAVAGFSGPYCWGDCWDALPPLTRETFTAKSGASGEEDARERAMGLTLEPVIDGLVQPALFVTGKLDRIIPAEQTERQAQRARNARFVCYEEGSHAVSNVPFKARPLVADWLREQLA